MDQTPAHKDKTINHDPELREKLEDAHKKVPRYLFRMWRSLSGGDNRLNTTERVMPHAYHHSVGHTSMFQMTKEYFIETVQEHLYGERTIRTEFSSWTASPSFALQYATHCSSEHPHIAIIDITKLDNSIFHVPVLDKIFDCKCFGRYHEEYLIHGIIDGEGYKAVALQELLARGLREFPRLIKAVSPWDHPRRISSVLKPVTAEEIRAMWNIAEPYGSMFRIPMTISLICLRKRSPSFLKTGDSAEKVVAMCFEVLDRDALFEWCLSLGEVKDIYDARYEDNAQMYHLLCALRNYCYGGKGAQTPAKVVSSGGGERLSAIEGLGVSFGKMSVARNRPVWRPAW